MCVRGCDRHGRPCRLPCLLLRGGGRREPVHGRGRPGRFPPSAPATPPPGTRLSVQKDPGLRALCFCPQHVPSPLNPKLLFPTGQSTMVMWAPVPKRAGGVGAPPRMSPSHPCAQGPGNHLNPSKFGGSSLQPLPH